jgi:hypothetical protein
MTDQTSRFYKTAKWQRLRWSILVRDGFTCQDCGRMQIDTSLLHATTSNLIAATWRSSGQGRSARSAPPATTRTSKARRRPGASVCKQGSTDGPSENPGGGRFELGGFDS